MWCFMYLHHWLFVHMKPRTSFVPEVLLRFCNSSVRAPRTSLCCVLVAFGRKGNAGVGGGGCVCAAF